MLGKPTQMSPIRAADPFVIEGFGYIAPHIDEIDSWCSMGVRLAHNDAAGWVIELGPYDLDATDIHALRQAIHAYDHATGKAQP
ncbi:hypothetical protein MHPYR_320086 [uncultured Mycobacterium sp.]|uniref:Uncharacterized protein n=1 Tax=uncultured Mycobacterium sp. TaxID=171292 RepID=A0A1Y5PKT2_9MYCO|nr:hypothetical protein MHPYR_320086 [uncultured Mycobacterium sp.]